MAAFEWSASFKRGVSDALKTHGFRRERGRLVRVTEDVATLVAFDSDSQMIDISVGFHLLPLDSSIPDQVYRCHLYTKLAALFPAYSDAITDAGMASPRRASVDREESYDILLRDLRGPLGEELSQLGTVAALRSALRVKRLTRGLIAKEAQAFLRDPDAIASRARSLVGRSFTALIGGPWDFESAAGEGTLAGVITRVEVDAAGEPTLFCDVSAFTHDGVTIRHVAAVSRYSGVAAEQVLLTGGKWGANFVFRRNGEPPTTAEAETSSAGRYTFLIGSMKLSESEPAP